MVPQAPDPTTQGQAPWWQRAAAATAAAGNGMQPQPRTSPWGGLGKSLGTLGGAVLAKRAQQRGMNQAHDANQSAAVDSAVGPMQPMDPGPPPDDPGAGVADMSGVEDMGIPAADGVVVTKPTRVLLAEHGQPEAVVPLGFRATAKVRPSVARPGRNYYGG